MEDGVGLAVAVGVQVGEEVAEGDGVGLFVTVGVQVEVVEGVDVGGSDVLVEVIVGVSLIVKQIFTGKLAS